MYIVVKGPFVVEIGNDVEEELAPFKVVMLALELTLSFGFVNVT